jgi:hypothetical protein
MIFLILASYEFLCIVQMYSIGIPKSETVSDPSILDNGYRTVYVEYFRFMMIQTCSFHTQKKNKLLHEQLTTLSH